MPHNGRPFDTRLDILPVKDRVRGKYETTYIKKVNGHYILVAFGCVGLELPAKKTVYKQER